MGQRRAATVRYGNSACKSGMRGLPGGLVTLRGKLLATECLRPAAPGSRPLFDANLGLRLLFRTEGRNLLGAYQGIGFSRAALNTIATPRPRMPAPSSDCVERELPRKLVIPTEGRNPLAAYLASASAVPPLPHNRDAVPIEPKTIGPGLIGQISRFGSLASSDECRASITSNKEQLALAPRIGVSAGEVDSSV